MEVFGNMTKLRVYELAKELGIENKQLLGILNKKGLEVKSQNSLEQGIVDEIRSEFSRRGQESTLERTAQARPEHAKLQKPQTEGKPGRDDAGVSPEKTTARPSKAES